VSITIAGNVTRNPTTSRPKTGLPTRATFGIVEHQKWIDFRTGEPGEASTLLEVNCRGGLAENVVSTVRQGDRVIVSGRLGRAEWTNAAGLTSERFFLLAEDVALSLWATSAIPDDDGVDSEARA
jgi:single-stranded DNA-binding protein